jgi:hypothetical protein
VIQGRNRLRRRGAGQLKGLPAQFTDRLVIVGQAGNQAGARLGFAAAGEFGGAALSRIVDYFDRFAPAESGGAPAKRLISAISSTQSSDPLGT